MVARDVNDLIRHVAAKIRNSFMLSGPSPVFEVEVKGKEVSFNGLSRVKFDNVLDVGLNEAEIVGLLSEDVQSKVNRALKRSPVVLSGTCSVRFTVSEGRVVILNDVPWRVSINEIKRLELLGNDVTIADFGYDDYSFKCKNLKLN